MAIIFKVLRYQNFISTGNVFTEILLDRNKTTLVVGENGSGKSTILDALTFVLFGKAYRDINKPQLVNTITKKNMLVEVEFDVGTIHYKICRGIRPNVFEIYKNNELINQSSESKDYQQILEKQILKVNFKSFCQVVVLGSATFKPFMQLRTGDRREVIEDLLDLQIFTSMNSLLKNRIMMNGHAMIENSKKREFIEEKIKIVKDHLLELQKNDISLIEEKKERIANALLAKRATIEELDQKQKVLDTVYDSIKTKPQLERMEKTLDSYKNSIESKIKLLEKDILFLKEKNDCPTCKQKIDINFKESSLNEKTKELETLSNGIKELNVKINTNIGALKLIKEREADIQSRILDLNTLKNNIRNYEKYIEEKELELKNIENKPVNNDNKLVEFDKELQEIKQEEFGLIDNKEILISASTLLKDGGIKAKIIKQYVPIINKLINKYLSALDFFVQFELNEEFEEKIKSRFRDEFSYASFSEGEKMRINLAVLFTWRAVAKLRNSINTNLLIMDEVFDSSLDGNGTDEFLKLLNNITSDTNTFIISHKKDQLLEKFEHIIKFEKKQNFSRII